LYRGPGIGRIPGPRRKKTRRWQDGKPPARQEDFQALAATLHQTAG
jgi:hypothetical protein